MKEDVYKRQEPEQSGFCSAGDPGVDAPAPGLPVPERGDVCAQAGGLSPYL